MAIYEKKNINLSGKRIILGLLVLFLIYIIIGAKTVKGEEEEKGLTLMIYMIGSDLESGSASASEDVEEIMNSGVDYDDVNILVYTGGAKKWHNESISDDKNCVFLLDDSEMVLVDSSEQRSMGEAQTLADFLQFGRANYPAKEYGLILWNHGNGPLIGYGMDKVYGNDAMTLMEMKAALEASPFAKENRLSFVGFDACLMSSAELVCIMDDYTDYLLASEETEPAFGWNYSFLSNYGKMELQDFLSTIPDEYLGFCNDYFSEREFFKSDVTLALLDMSYGRELEAALGIVFEKAAKDISGDYPELALERIHSKGIGRASTGSEYDLVDVQRLMEMMSDKYPEECGDVLDILSQIIINNRTNTEDCSGLSLYYPYYNKKYYSSAWKSVYNEMGLLPSYLTYLSRYEQIWLGTPMQQAFEDKLLPEEGQSGVYTLQLTEEQNEVYAQGKYYILRRVGDDLYQIVYSSTDVKNENGLLTAGFDGRILLFESGDGSSCIPVGKLTDSKDEYTYYSVVCEFQVEDIAEALINDSEAMVFAELQLSLDNRTGFVEKRAIYELEQSVPEFMDAENDILLSGKRRALVPDNYYTVNFWNMPGSYLTRDDNGILLPVLKWPREGWMDGMSFDTADGIHFALRPLYDDGSDYYLVFNITDVQNNEYSSELYPIQMKETPEANNVPDSQSVEMAKNGSCVVYNDKGIRATLFMIQSPLNGARRFAIQVENQSDSDVSFYIRADGYNDSIITDSVNDFLDAPRGKSVYTVLQSFDAERINCVFGGLDKPESLDLVLEIDEESGKTIQKETKIHVTVPNDVSYQSVWVPFMGALAEEQVIYDEGDLVISLKNAGYLLTENLMGNYPEEEYEHMTVLLYIQNNSDYVKTVSSDGIYISGEYIENVYTEPYMLSVPAGCSGVIQMTVISEDILDAGIESIESIDLYINSGDVNQKMPVKLLIAE